MNKKSLSEVYSILNDMDTAVIDRIPNNFINYIKENRDILYNPKFEKIPDNFDNLEHDTKAMFALIYKKYFEDYDSKKVKLDINIENSITEENVENKELIVYKENIIDKFLSKIKDWWNRIIKK